MQYRGALLPPCQGAGAWSGAGEVQQGPGGWRSPMRGEETSSWEAWGSPATGGSNPARSWDGLLSWFCNFAIGIPHHNIMDKREELRIPEDLTVREGRHITEDTSSGCARCFFTFACCRERSGCAFQAGRLHQVRLSVSETLSLSLSLPLYRSFALSPSFHLVYYTYSQLDCIVSCHLASQHHS